MAIFIVVTKCTLSTLTGKNAKESEGILDFPLCTTMDQWKTNIFSSRGCIVSPYVVVLQMNSVSSWVQLKAFVLALSCRCRFTIKSRGRKWGEGSECDTNRKRALCSCLLLGAHERFIPNFVFFQGILWALPGAYITNTGGRYQLTKALKSVTDQIFSFTQTYVSADLSY